MKKEIDFLESQRFRQWWLWLTLAAISCGVLILRLQKPGAYAAWLSVDIVVLVLIQVLLFSIRLETRISSDGVYVRFFPFHIRFRHYEWSGFDQVSMRHYRPIVEYGGWGLRFGLRNGMAYTISGCEGLQLVFKNGSKLLIGTRRPEELKRVLQELEREAI